MIRVKRIKFKMYGFHLPNTITITNFLLAFPYIIGSYMVLPYIILFTNNECLILHRKAFRADYISRSAKICAPSSARIPAVLLEF